MSARGVSKGHWFKADWLSKDIVERLVVKRFLVRGLLVVKRMTLSDGMASRAVEMILCQRAIIIFLRRDIFG